MEGLRELAAEAGAEALAVVYRDLETGEQRALEPDRWFHAASTIKLAVLVALYEVIEKQGIGEDARLHVRNQFTSAADGRYYRVRADRDGNQTVHGYIGRTMRIGHLARHMIVTSSNLATNVLVEMVGADGVRASLERLGIDGIDFRRGVEDERAWQEGINNRVTAAGLADLLQRIAEEEAVSPEASRHMLEVLHDQQFVSGIPAGVPDDARVANKTGEISTVVHDAGIVYLPDRRPYVLVVLTEWAEDGSTSDRRSLIAEVSRRVSAQLVAPQVEAQDA